MALQRITLSMEFPMMDKATVKARWETAFGLTALSSEWTCRVLDVIDAQDRTRMDFTMALRHMPSGLEQIITVKWLTPETTKAEQGLECIEQLLITGDLKTGDTVALSGLDATVERTASGVLDRVLSSQTTKGEE